MADYLKPPMLSTSFSESGKKAKKRFENILTPTAKKRGFAALSVIAAAVLATVAVLPQITGIAAHECLGLVALAAFLLHLAASLNALSSLLKAARFGSALAVARIVLDAALFIAIAVCIVSGVLISATVLPMFGLFAPGYFIWNPLHAASAKILLALVLVHVASHAGKLVALAKK